MLTLLQKELTFRTLESYEPVAVIRQESQAASFAFII